MLIKLGSKNINSKKQTIHIINSINHSQTLNTSFLKFLAYLI
ncbi:hypothetical protein FHS11_001310 [Mucilaginibacter gotjawali]|uniref:Uncharacterized protein n=1 Tax=Mucilaginibacter gotjawali TaxID=1550579 RepID=A0A839SCA8_9SPHI|nr:hypothetical protein [Mucilaginibacter gotjawali]